MNPVRLLSRSLLTVAAIIAAVLWLQPDLKSRSTLPAAMKMILVFGAAAACTTALDYLLWRKWASHVGRLNAFIAALPLKGSELPEQGPAELETLSRTIRAMSQRVFEVVERGGLESSRREAILACMAEGVLAVDAGLKVIFCNQAFSEAFSIRIPATQGRTLYEIVREPALRDILQRVLQTGASEKDRFQLPTAASRWFEARALPLGSEPKRGAVIVLHDITDLQHQEQVRKDFVADVSHELRTPLSAIRGYAETLLDGALEDTQNNRKFVEIILSHSVRLANIASDLLVLSELDSGGAPAADQERVSIVTVVEAAVRTVENAASTRRVTLVWKDLCQECFVSGFRFRLEQALVNLLDNAVKFNREDGEVRVECGYTDDGHVRISVADNGIGIPSGEVKRVFERFYRVDKARSRPVGGTGLGLPIVKEVVERMGGSITVESVLGRGSKFIIILDAA